MKKEEESQECRFQADCWKTEAEKKSFQAFCFKGLAKSETPPLPSSLTQMCFWRGSNIWEWNEMSLLEGYLGFPEALTG